MVLDMLLCGHRIGGSQPLFVIAGLGYLVGRRMRPDLSQANKLNMDVFVPALVFAQGGVCGR
mgnify:CR=1 FL=1